MPIYLHNISGFFGVYEPEFFMRNAWILMLSSKYGRCMFNKVAFCISFVNVVAVIVVVVAPVLKTFSITKSVLTSRTRIEHHRFTNSYQQCYIVRIKFWQKRIFINSGGYFLFLLIYRHTFTKDCHFFTSKVMKMRWQIVAKIHSNKMEILLGLWSFHFDKNAH